MAGPQVFIHCSDEGLKTELESLLGDETLKREPELSNGVDDLRFVLMVSKVSLMVRVGFVFAGRMWTQYVNRLQSSSLPGVVSSSDKVSVLDFGMLHVAFSNRFMNSGFSERHNYNIGSALVPSRAWRCPSTPCVFRTARHVPDQPR